MTDDLTCHSWSRCCGRSFHFYPGGPGPWPSAVSPQKISSTSCGRPDVLLGQGKTIGEACKVIGVTDHTCSRWRKQYGGLKVDQAKRLKELELENARLKRVVTELTVDKLILNEVAEGKY